MLDSFLRDNRTEIITRARAKVATRAAPRATPEELRNGVPLFLDQLIETLSRAAPSTAAIGASATKHGRELLEKGFTIAQVVHDYGDVCQAVTELADELQAPITVEEFHTFNGCLDDAIAGAVTEYTRLRDAKPGRGEAERLGELVHELRNRLGAAMLAYALLKDGQVGIGGSTSAVIDRNLSALRDLIDRSLADVRLASGARAPERISVFRLLEEVELDASLAANGIGIQLTVAPVDRALEVVADRPTIAAAVANLLQNAIKFSHPRGHVSLRTTATADRVTFEVQDQCGGLPAGKAEELFRPFTQESSNREGIGLGLSITRRGIEANGGQVRVRDLPGEGCVFSIELPRHTPG